MTDAPPNALEQAQRIIEIGIIYSRQKHDGKAVSRLEEMQLHTQGYAEPGYTDPEGGVICLGNYNDINRYDKTTRQFILEDPTPKWAADQLEKIGVELEWDDEWYACGECYALVRTISCGFDWTPSYWCADGEILCEGCVRNDPSDYLESLDGGQGPMELDIDPTKHDYVEIEDSLDDYFEVAQWDNPRSLREALKEIGVERFVYTLTRRGDLASVFIHVYELEGLVLRALEAVREE
jgi:hypothetical protein